MSSKVLYIRTVSTVTDDDASSDSVFIPISMFRGMQRASATLATFEYENPVNYADIDSANTLTTLITITSEGFFDLFNDIAKEISTGENAVIVIGDDVTEEYVSSQISDIGLMQVGS